MISHKLTHLGPHTGLIKYWIAYFILKIIGWDIAGEVPRTNKFVFIGAPHSTNWDLFFMLMAFYIFRIKMSWMGKQSLFKPPIGIITKAIGGIPINRDKRQGVVEQFAELYNNSEKLVIGLSPEGTRSHKDYWRSGFYWIAHKAQIPIVCGYVDYKHKKAVMGMAIVPTGNVKEDMDKIRDFYKKANLGYLKSDHKIRLREEDSTANND